MYIHTLFFGGLFFKSLIEIVHKQYPVMITIFCDFHQFSATKLTFFSKTNVMINFFHNLALFWVKNAIFSPNFLAEIFLKSWHRSLVTWSRHPAPSVPGPCSRSASGSASAAPPGVPPDAPAAGPGVDFTNQFRLHLKKKSGKSTRKI
jgi:hypothetical protein